MLIKIGGDTLALDAKIRRHMEAEAQKLSDRFPDQPIEAHATIQEEFDPMHGHRVRCELRIRLEHGRQVVVRDAQKKAAEAISEVFTSARRSIRRLRRQTMMDRSPAAAVAEGAASIASR